MVRHLEMDHFKNQITTMEKFAVLGCRKCGFKIGNVHAWSAHFTDADFRDCHGCEVGHDSSSKRPKISGPQRIPKEMIANKDSPRAAAQDNEEEEDEDNSEDAPLKFFCSNCPEEFDHLLDLEFHLEGCNIGGEEETKSQDLRILKCKVCEAVIKGQRVFSVLKHLREEHDREGEKWIGFGCGNCPNFNPQTTLLWDRHFGPDYALCQGDSKVENFSKPVFWCDTCKEMNENIADHFANETHQSNVMNKRKDQSRLSCRGCDLLFTTTANRRLHENLASHSRP